MVRHLATNWNSTLAHLEEVGEIIRADAASR